METLVYFSESHIPYRYLTVETLLDLQNKKLLQFSVGLFIKHTESQDRRLLNQIPAGIDFVYNRKPPDWYSCPNKFTSYDHTITFRNGLHLIHRHVNDIQNIRGMSFDFIISFDDLDPGVSEIARDRLRAWHPLKCGENL